MEVTVTKAHSELDDNDGRCERCNRPETKGLMQTAEPVYLVGGLGWGTMWLCNECLRERREREQR
jgi:hypothetical protein